jgi:hypothetical protein
MSRGITLPIITIICHQLGPNSPAWPSCNSLFKGLPSRLRPFGLKSSIIFGILLLYILGTCRSQFGFYLDVSETVHR